MAGVTILAFGNGAPDIFTSYSSILVGKGELAYNELVGGGMFVTTVVISCICILYPFRVVGSLFVRDVCCYILGTVYTYVVFYSGYVGLGKTAGFVLLYTGYIVLVLLARYTHKKAQFKEIFVEEKSLSQVWQERRRTPSGDEDKEDVPAPEEEQSLASAYRIPEADPHIIHLSPSRVLKLLGQYPAGTSRVNSTSSSTVGDLALQAERIMMLSLMDQHDLIEEERSQRLVSPDSIKRRPVGLWSTFLHEIKPLDIETWKNDLLITKVISIIKIPVILVFKFIVPVVNLTAINHGWCRLLNTSHCVTMPLFAVFVLNYAHIQLFDSFSLWLLVLILGACLAVVVFFTSKSYIPPRYHELFSIAGFIASVLAIKKVAGEVVCILHAVGIMLSITEGTLGLTLLAWGNSLGDLIANVAIAKAGFQRMGFAACFGGPMFNSLLGLGASFTAVMIEEKTTSVKVGYGALGPTCALFLIFSLMSSAILIPLMGFQVRKSYGVYLLILYSMFLMVCVLTELDIIHSLGTHHPR